ncbi:MAG: O-antigen ligase family protein [Verrucomicrobia bacterium]|nr:O-antigen ligase family protein [Verrucomicrobiota bacterium]
MDRVRLWERRALILLLYAMPLHESSKNLLWGLVAGLWLWRSLAEKCSPQMGCLEWSALGWLGAGLWATCFAIEPSASWKGLWDMARAAALLWIARTHLRDEDFRHTLVRHLVFSTALASAIAWVDYGFAILEPDRYIPKVRVQLRSVGHFNHSGTYLAMAWMLALAGCIEKKVFVHSWMGIAAAAVIGLGLLGTTARTAIAATFLISLGILWQTRSPRWLGLMLLTGVALIVFGLVASAGLRSRLLFRGSFGSRITFWQAAWETTCQRPWTGVGLNNFKHIPISAATGSGRPAGVDHAHNLYFNTLAQAGIPGIVALLALLTSAATLIWRCRPGAAKNGLIYWGTGGVWLILVLVGMSSTTLHHEIGMFFFLTMALAAASQPRTYI